MPDRIPEIIDAISRLNTHARAWGFGKKAIYAYKTFVAAEFATEARPVFVMVQCHHCSGTGIYRDWDGYQRGRCYRCTEGVVTLQFVESTIGECRWHHPVGGNGGGESVLNAVWGIQSVRYPESGGSYPHGLATLADGTERPIEYVQAEGWGPNMPGAEKLPAEDACGLLNLVENWMETLPVNGRTSWPRKAAMDERFRYRAVLDRDDDRHCSECGSPDVADVMCGGSSSWGHGWADYSRRMCGACHGPRDAPRWPTAPHPSSLTPNVMAWLHRRWPTSFKAREDWYA